MDLLEWSVGKGERCQQPSLWEELEMDRTLCHRLLAMLPTLGLGGGGGGGVSGPHIGTVCSVTMPWTNSKHETTVVALCLGPQPPWHPRGGFKAQQPLPVLSRPVTPHHSRPPYGPSPVHTGPQPLLEMLFLISLARSPASLRMATSYLGFFLVFLQ